MVLTVMAVGFALGFGGFICGVIYSDWMKREIQKDVNAMRDELARLRALVRL